MFKRTHAVIAGAMALAASVAIALTLVLVNGGDGDDTAAAVMPLFMDTHTGLNGVSAEEVAGVHALDLEIQEQYGVEFIGYTFDEDEGTAQCIFRGPNKEAGDAVHLEAHGLTADKTVALLE